MQLFHGVAGLKAVGVRIGEFLHLFRKGVAAHAITWVIICLYFGAYSLAHVLWPDLVPAQMFQGFLSLLWMSVPPVIFSIAVLRFYHVARFDKPHRLTLAVIQDWARFLTNPQRLANGIPMFFVMVLFAFIFTDVKSNILQMNPTVWDQTLSNLDRVIHFGRQPWEWLQPIFGYPRVTFLLNLNYNIWFFVMWMFFTYFGFTERPSELRTRFFLTFLVTWIIGGSLLATIFASGGPCYYARLGFWPDPYSDLMIYLRSTNLIMPVWAIEVQDMLWNSHLAHGEMGEISALPSMHNATTLLFVITSFKLSRFWGWVLLTHAVFVFIGSISLAWHYAIDSYVSWALALALWFALAPVARWWHSSHEQRTFDEMLTA